MKAIFAFLLLLASVGAGAQTMSWRVVVNKRTVLKTATENEQKNVVTLPKAALKKNGALSVCLTEKGKLKDWKRVIGVFDEKDKELWHRDSSILVVSTAQLSALAPTAKKIKVYTWQLPLDPNVAATVRVRRVHLCTLVIH